MKILVERYGHVGYARLFAKIKDLVVELFFY